MWKLCLNHNTTTEKSISLLPNELTFLYRLTPSAVLHISLSGLVLCQKHGRGFIRARLTNCFSVSNLTISGTETVLYWSCIHRNRAGLNCWKKHVHISRRDSVRPVLRSVYISVSLWSVWTSGSLALPCCCSGLVGKTHTRQLQCP